MENKLKHLEFIQLVTNRMAGNSFLLKAWTVTLVLAVLTFATEASDKRLVTIAYLPILVFWLLDGFFLSQEKLFRALYDDVRKKAQSEIDFSMDTRRFRNFRNGWVRSLFSTTLLLFYILLVGVTILAVRINR